MTQIARTISRALRLNEDLTEAIGLGHDLGHTPFGHCGEDVLDRLVPGGFEHNRQSLRVVDKLENGGRGLNLTFEVRDGILNHKKDGSAATLEGRVVSLADRIAYLNHDIDDAIRAGVISNADLPESCLRVLGDRHSARINTMICDVVAMSADRPEVRMSDPVAGEFENLRNFMFERVYKNPVAKGEEVKARRVVEELFRYYMQHVDLLPDEFLIHREADGDERVVADFIACMTDNYAVDRFNGIFVPRSWA